MHRVFIDLADKITILYEKDRYIVSLEDFDYLSAPLDLIYSKLVGLPIEDAIVILHGTANGSGKYKIQLLNTSVSENKSDYEALQHLLKGLGAQGVTFLEYLGLGVYVFSNNVAVDQIDGEFRVIAFKDGSMGTQVCSSDSLYQTISFVKNEQNADKVVDLKRYFKPAFMAYFKNSDFLKSDEERAIVSLFGFAMTEDAIALSLIDANIFIAPEPVLQEQDDLSMDNAPVKQKKKKTVVQEEAQVSPKKNNVKKKNRKKKKFGFPVGVSIFFILLNCSAVVGSYAGCKYLRNNAAERQFANNNLLADYQESVSQVNAYEAIEDSSDDSASLYGIVSNIDALKLPSDAVIDASNDSVEITGSCRSKNSITALKSSLKKNFSNAGMEVQKNKKTYSFKISL